jgi:hypothetical protein
MTTNLDQNSLLWSLEDSPNYGTGYGKMTLQDMRYREIIEDKRIAVDQKVAAQSPSQKQMLPEDYAAERFFLLKSYDDILRSGFDDLLLKRMFGVGKPVLQFKERCLLVESGLDWYRHQYLRSKHLFDELSEDMLVVDLPRENYLAEDLPTFCCGPDSKLSNLRDCDSSQSSTAEIKITAFERRYLRAEVSIDAQTFLVFNSGYEKHWQALVDGEPTRIYRGDGHKIAIEVGKGDRIVELTHLPYLWILGIYVFNGIPLLGILALVTFLGTKRWKNRKCVPAL